jgi:hypothetical protein
MTTNEIHKALAEIRESFPKSSKMFLGFIERADKTGAFEGSTQRGAVIAMKNAWQLENRTPTVSFSPTDEKVIDYLRKASGDAQQSPCKLMVVIDMASNATNVWLLPKGGMCFIATAACGDPFAPEVIALCTFRDDHLSRTRAGRCFIRLYYAVSPSVAATIDRSATLRRAAMAIIVRPAARLAEAGSRRGRSGGSTRVKPT